MAQIPKEVVVAISSAILGGLFTILATYVNFRVKRFELKYSYKNKLEESYFLNAKQHLNDIYIPLYKLLLIFKKSWLSLIKSEDFISSVNIFISKEIQTLENFKENLENQGLTAFLLPDIENSFEQLLVFLSQSLVLQQLVYKLIIEYERYKLNNIVSYNKEITIFSKKQNKNLSIYQKTIIIQAYKSVLNFVNFLKTILPFSLVDYEVKVTVASAPLQSKEFEVQLLSFITDINNKIKDLTLGIR